MALNATRTATKQKMALEGRAEDGFALPFTIFMVTLITIMLAASFTRAASEHLVASSSNASLSALSIAESGLQAFFGDTFTVRPAETDSFRYNTVGGYAWVSPDVMQRPADTLQNFMYVVRSVGHVIEPSQGSDPVARRTIAQFARWQTGSMNVVGAFVTPNGVISRFAATPPAVLVLGNDVPGCPTGIAPPVWSIRAPDADSIGGVEIDTITATMTQEEQDDWPQTVALETGVNWNQIVTGGFTADYNTIQYGDLTYPTQLIIGDATVNSVGYGLLMVTGDLTFSGGFAQWNGVILVGGKVDFNASSAFVYGTVISGLNEQFGVSPPASAIGGPGFATRIQYSSCSVDDALRSLTGFVPLENARVDNWATY